MHNEHSKMINYIINNIFIYYFYYMMFFSYTFMIEKTK